MPLTREHKRYLKKHAKTKRLSEIAAELGLPEKMIRDYLKEKLPPDKYDALINGNKQSNSPNTLFPSISLLSWLKQHWGYFAFLAFLVFATYANSIGGDLVSDDVGIIRNPEFKTLKFATTRSLLIVRPLIYYVISNMFGEAPWPYHLLNILFHLGNVWVLFVLIFMFSSIPIALLTASIFAVHPAISEAVTWISGGGYAQYSFFVLSSLLTFILSLKKRKYYYISLVLALLSTLSGDRSIQPFVILLFVFLFTDIKKTWKKVVPYFAIASIFFYKYISLITTRIESVKHEQFAETISSNPVLQIPTAISTYLELYIWPDRLTFYYSDFIMTSFVYSSRVLAFLVFIALLFITYRWFKQVFFWLALFILALAPTLTPWGLSSIVNERYGYLSSVGFFFLVSYVVGSIFKAKKYETTLYFVFMIVIIALSVRTIIRNLDYKNEDALWIATGKTAIYSPVTHMNLGDMHRRHKNYVEAEREFVNAIKLNPNNAYAYYNLGLVYTEARAYDGAVAAYEKALSIDKTLWQAHQNISVVFHELGQYEKAIKHLDAGIAGAPMEISLYINKAVIYNKLGKQAESKATFKKALEIDPGNVRVQEAMVKIGQPL